MQTDFAEVYLLQVDKAVEKPNSSLPADTSARPESAEYRFSRDVTSPQGHLDWGTLESQTPNPTASYPGL